jgi:hypothetical protein
MKLAPTFVAGLSLLVVSSSHAQRDPGVQKESDWVDVRWNATELGNFHASTVALPGGAVAKGLSIRTGDARTVSAVYDTARATLCGIWTDGFLKFDSARYGLLRAPRPDGDVRFLAPGSSAWNDRARWRGLHVNGPRVVLEYFVGDSRVLETPWVEQHSGATAMTRTFEIAPNAGRSLTLSQATSLEISTNDGVKLASVELRDERLRFALAGNAGEFLTASGLLRLRFQATKEPARVKLFYTTDSAEQLVALVKQSAAPEDLTALARPGAPRWTPLTTRGQRGFGNDAFVIDMLTMPYNNPWKALMFGSGVDFLPNGDALVCTIHGDVWLVSGIDDKLEKLTWRRFATGLFQPLGLRVRDGRPHVLGRDQITILHDENNDGEADFYENFFNGIRTSTGGHDYVTSLEMDTNGNFYYVDPRGAHRVARDGSRLDTLGAGFRNPNGMGVSPDGTIVTVAPQQGEWTPSSALFEARGNSWHGYGGPRVSADRPLGYDPPLCWIPHAVDNSGGSQIWVTSERWHPLMGQLLHLSWGRCAQMLVLREVVDGVAQGAVAPLPGRFISGPMRGAFNPRDGQLYVAGSTGWQTAAARDGCLQRVRFTGANPRVPTAFHVHTNGIRLSFTTELNRTAVEDAGSYSFAHWNYRYSKDYGSKDYLPSDAGKEGHESLDVKAGKLLPDGKTLFVEVAGLKPVMQFELKYSLNSADGKPMRSAIWGTINRLGAKF